MSEPAVFQEPLSSAEAQRAEVAFFVLEIIGSHIMLPMLIGTYIFVGRNVYHANMFITWVIASIGLCLLYYAREVASDTITPICVAQSAFVFALPPMLSTSLLCMMYNLWIGLEPKPVWVLPRAFRLLTLLTLPYFVLLLFSIWGAVVALEDIGGVSRRHYFYCSVRHGTYSIAAAATSATLLVVSLVIAARIFFLAVKSGPDLYAMRQGYGNQLSLVARTLVFALAATISSSLAVVSFVTPSIAPDMCMATLPVFFGILFGSSRDVWKTWLNRRPAPTESPPQQESELEVGKIENRKRQFLL